MRVLCGAAYRAGSFKEGTHVDIAYLALLAVLVGMTAGYIVLCAKLEDRK
jgi:hypothetical protein